jgi:mono/diheme cytochrome c family protein
MKVLCGIILLFTGCSVNADPSKGKTLYVKNCISCHGNPLRGAMGPDLWGSSEELIRLRVRELKYPDGYKPKRKTKLMRPFPKLTDQDIKYLHEYLNQPKESY